jgi:hypothetical protein
MRYNLIFSLLFPLFGNAQTTNSAQLQNQMQAANSFFSSTRSSYIPLYKVSESEVEGSKYFSDDYLTGELWATDGRHFTDEYVYKFDELENTVQIKDKNGREIQLLRVDIKACMMRQGTRTALFFQAEVPDEDGMTRLFQLIYQSNNYLLLKLPKKRLRTRPQKGMLNDNDFKDTYVSEPIYYLQEGKNDFVKIKLKKADILKALPQKQATVQALFEQSTFKGKIDEAKLTALLMELEQKDK